MSTGEGGHAPRDLTDTKITAILRGDPLTAAEQRRYARAANEIVKDERERQRQRLNRVWKAIRLARNLDDCRALLHGEHIPPERLDQTWLHRFGWRRAA